MKKKQLFLIFLSLILVAVVASAAVIYFFCPNVKKTLNCLEPETKEIPCFVCYEDVIGNLNGQPLQLLDFVTNQVEVSTDDIQIQNVLFVKDGCVWFVYYTFPDKYALPLDWNIATISLDGSNLKILHTEPMAAAVDETDDGVTIREQRRVVDHFYEHQYSFYHDGKIILTNQKDVVEYDIATGNVQRMTAEDYHYPNTDAVLMDFSKNQFKLELNGKTHVMTPQLLAEKSPAFAKLLRKLQSEKNGNKEDVCTFESVQETSDGQHYIICEVLDHWGFAYAVVFSYDVENDNVAYCFYHFTCDSVGSNPFYIVPKIN